MSEDTAAESPFSGIDLEKMFQPDWVKQPASGAGLERMAQKYDREEARGGDGPRRGGFDPSKRRFDDRKPGGARGPKQDARGGAGRGGPRRDDRRDDRREERRPEPPPVLRGWSVVAIPDRRGIEGLAKQIRSSGKAYPLFDLAALILEKGERYLIRLKRETEEAPVVFQLKVDGSLWMSEKEAIGYVLARLWETFYRRERVEVEAPKGAFAFVAVCGDIVLGPPNHHAYQARLREVHAERFRNMPFEAFKQRVQMVKDPEVIEKWKAEQSSRDEYYPLETPEGAEPLKLVDLAAVESHFRANHAPTLIEAVRTKCEVPGAVLAGASSTPIRQLLTEFLSETRRFPISLAHGLSQSFAGIGLQIFKAHDNITYVSAARPRYLDRVGSPVAESLAVILDYLESAPSKPRNEQWQDLLSLRSQPEEVAGREAALASDLSWLIHQGHVMDFAKRGLEGARKPQPAREQPKKKQQAPRAPKPQVTEALAEPEGAPDL